MEKRRKNRVILSHRYSDPRFRRKKTGSSHGTYAAIHKIVSDYSLDKMLGQFFSERDMALLLDLASCSIVEESNVAQHYPDYAYNHPLYSSGMKIYSDASVSDFFKSITKDKSTGFLNEWNAKRNQRVKGSS